jgi:hypothetical protein
MSRRKEILVLASARIETRVKSQTKSIVGRNPTLERNIRGPDSGSLLAMRNAAAGVVPAGAAMDRSTDDIASKFLMTSQMSEQPGRVNRHIIINEGK